MTIVCAVSVLLLMSWLPPPPPPPPPSSLLLLLLHHRSRYILAGVATVVWLPADSEGIMNDVKEAFQRRNENDFLFRAKRLSEWFGSSVDYDEFIAPTRPLEKNEKVRRIRRAPTHAHKKYTCMRFLRVSAVVQCLDCKLVARAVESS